MARIQIRLEPEERLRLEALARSRQRPLEDLVREAVCRYLESQTRSLFENDSLLELIGAGGSLETAQDVAANHHRYLVLDPC